MDQEKVWKSVLEELERSVSQATFDVCFSQARLESVVGDLVTIGIPNFLICQLVRQRHASLVKRILDRHTEKNFRILFRTAPKERGLSPLEKAINDGKRGADLFAGWEYQSTWLRARTRTYGLHIRPTKDGRKYLEITETRFQTKTTDHTRAKIIIFPEQAQAFANQVFEMAARLV
jgi:chromosomal replication initiation ATPase DnaA